jgi:hypothetical protein
VNANPHHDPDHYKTALDWLKEAREAYRKAAAAVPVGRPMTGSEFATMRMWQAKGDRASRAALAAPLAKELGR